MIKSIRQIFSILLVIFLIRGTTIPALIFLIGVSIALLLEVYRKSIIGTKRITERRVTEITKHIMKKYNIKYDENFFVQRMDKNIRKDFPTLEFKAWFNNDTMTSGHVKIQRGILDILFSFMYEFQVIFNIAEYLKGFKKNNYEMSMKEIAKLTFTNFDLV